MAITAPPGFTGQLLHDGDPGYDEARSVFNGMIDRRPLAVARCSTPDEVAAALALARDRQLDFTVRSGGHGVSGSAVADGALMIDLSPMKTIDIDVEARTARVGAGVNWGELDAATQEHGLAITGGRVSNTGVAGLTLASGSGWLERAFGLTCDSLTACTMVAADGRVVRASATEEPELFWGLRGGGGNFGIVTEFEFVLHPLGPIVAGGMLVYPFDFAEQVLKAAREFMATAPDEVSISPALICAPPEPFVPPEVVGQPVVGIVALHTGADVDAGLAALAPIKQFAPVAIDMVGPMPYVALQGMLDHGNPWGAHAYFKAAFMTELSDGFIHDFIELRKAAPSPMTALLLQPLGGAFARVGDEETALGHRSTAKWAWHALSVWMDPAQDEANLEFARLVQVALTPHSMEAVHPNYVSDAGAARVRSFYSPQAWERLVALKRAWDPENRFCHNQNITP